MMLGTITSWPITAEAVAKAMLTIAQSDQAGVHVHDLPL